MADEGRSNQLLRVEVMRAITATMHGVFSARRVRNYLSNSLFDMITRILCFWTLLNAHSYSREVT